MAFDFNIQNDLLWITVTGVFSDREARSLVPEAARMVQETGAERILIDYLKADMVFQTVGVYDVFTKTVPKEPSLYGIRTAAVFSPSEDANDVRFVENVAINYGLIYRAFTDIDAARAWLFEEHIPRHSQTKPPGEPGGGVGK